MMTEQEAVTSACDHPGQSANWLAIAAYIREMDERAKWSDGSVATKGLVILPNPQLTCDSVSPTGTLRQKCIGVAGHPGSHGGWRIWDD